MATDASGRAKRTEAITGVLAGVGLNALAVLIALRVLGPAGRGQMVALTLVATMVYVLFGMGLPAANVYIAAREPDAAGVLAGNALLTSLLLPTIAGLLSFALPARLLELTRLALTVDQLRLCIVLSTALFAFQQSASIVQGLGDYAALRRGRVVQGVLLIAGVSAAPLLSAPTPVMMLEFWAAAYAGAAAFFLANIWHSSRPGVSLRRLTDSIRYGARAMWSQIWEFVNMRGDQILVAGIASPAVLGVYATAVSLSEVLFHVPNAVSQVVFSDTAARIHADPHGRALREAGRVFWMTAVGGLILVAGAWVVVVPLTGLTVTQLIPSLAVMVLPMAAFSGARLLGACLMGAGRPELPGIAAAASFFVTIALDLILVPRWGALGAAMGVSGGYLIAAVVLLGTFMFLGRDATDIHAIVGDGSRGPDHE